MKKFKIFKSDGTTETIEANRVEWTKKKDGLSVKFTSGKKTQKFFGVSVLLEVSPEIVIEKSSANENEQDD